MADKTLGACIFFATCMYVLSLMRYDLKKKIKSVPRSACALSTDIYSGLSLNFKKPMGFSSYSKAKEHKTAIHNGLHLTHTSNLTIYSTVPLYK